MSTPPIYVGTSTVAPIPPINPSARSGMKSSHGRPVCVTKIDAVHGRVVEFPDSVTTHLDNTTSRGRDPHPWQHLSTNSPLFGHRSARSRKLETINLRGSRQISRSTLSNAHSSSGKRSDSVTNDSANTPETQDGRTNTSSDQLFRDTLSTESAGRRPRSSESYSLDKREMHMAIEKCMKWIEKLPAKFSSMHIVQERSPVFND